MQWVQKMFWTNWSRKGFQRTELRKRGQTGWRSSMALNQPKRENRVQLMQCRTQTVSSNTLHPVEDQLWGKQLAQLTKLTKSRLTENNVVKRWTRLARPKLSEKPTTMRWESNAMLTSKQWWKLKRRRFQRRKTMSLPTKWRSQSVLRNGQSSTERWWTEKLTSCQ